MCLCIPDDSPIVFQHAARRSAFPKKKRRGARILGARALQISMNVRQAQPWSLLEINVEINIEKWLENGYIMMVHDGSWWFMVVR